MHITSLHIITQAPHIMTKAPYIMVKAPHIMVKAPHIMMKAPHIMTKAPHIMTKAPHIMTKAPHIMSTTYNVKKNDHLRQSRHSIENGRFDSISHSAKYDTQNLWSNTTSKLLHQFIFNTLSNSITLLSKYCVHRVCYFMYCMSMFNVVQGSK